MPTEIIFDILIICDNKNSVHSMLRKKFEHEILPSTGMKIEDPAFGEDPKRPAEVTINYEANYCLVRFQPEEYKTPKECDNVEQGYRASSWKSPHEFEVRG